MFTEIFFDVPLDIDSNATISELSLKLNYLDPYLIIHYKYFIVVFPNILYNYSMPQFRSLFQQ